MENSGGVSLLHVMTFIFVILKLTGVVSWSWWLVLLPSLINFGLIAGMMLFVGAFAWSVYMRGKDKDNKK